MTVAGTLAHCRLPLALLTLCGCDAALNSIDRIVDAIERHEGEPDSPPPPVETLNPEQRKIVKGRPADSVARSETEVITFRNILRNQEMSREERIQAMLKLDPSALQNPNAAPPPNAATAGDSGSRARHRAPYDWEIANARRRVPVVMYSTSWCSVCKRARAYFEKARISFVEYDVDENAAARTEYLGLNPRRSVPTIKVGDEVIVGFSEGSVEQALDRSARLRLN